MSKNIETTLRQRQCRYGDFPFGARLSQEIKRVMRTSRNWNTLSHDKRESLEMIALKIGRILNGDPEHQDSWHDIAGYAKLASDNLKPEMSEKSYLQTVASLADRLSE